MPAAVCGTVVCKAFSWKSHLVWSCCWGCVWVVKTTLPSNLNQITSVNTWESGAWMASQLQFKCKSSSQSWNIRNVCNIRFLVFAPCENPPKVPSDIWWQFVAGEIVFAKSADRMFPPPLPYVVPLCHSRDQGTFYPEFVPQCFLRRKLFSRTKYQYIYP